MKKLARTVLGIILVAIPVVLGCSGVYSDVNSTVITWARLDFPPNYILSGKNAGNGAFEKVIKYLSRQLPQYDMHFVDISRKRLWAELKKQENYCEVGAQRTVEREQYGYFSIPMTLIPPAKIVLNRASWEALGKPEGISLPALLSNNGLVGSVMSARSYGHVVDVLLKSLESTASSNIQRQVIEPDSLYLMVATNRLDFTIGYEIVVDQFLQKMDSDNLKVVAITEEPSYQALHIVCTKNAWGEQIINDINEVLKHHRILDSFRQNFSVYGEAFNGGFYRRYQSDLDASGTDKLISDPNPLAAPFFTLP